MIAYISTQFAPAGCFAIYFYDHDTNHFVAGLKFFVFMMVNERLKCAELFNRLGVDKVEFDDSLPDDIRVMVKYLEKFNHR